MSKQNLVGLIQESPLLISGLLENASKHFGGQEIVTKLCPGEGNQFHRTNYFQLHQRAKQLGNALVNTLGIKKGDVVASLSFNSFRHMEVYYAVSGVGAVLHTLNPRLGDEQLTYITNHAGDCLLFVDLPCLPIAAKLAKQGMLPSSCNRFVVMVGEQIPVPPSVTQLLATPSARNIQLINYEGLLQRHEATFNWPTFDEKTAGSLCYTSGTTGNPKGVLYSHRSTVLHALGSSIHDCLNLRSFDTILTIVPLFHANAWGLAYSGALNGCKLVFPGVHVDGKSIAEFLEKEQVTRSFAVPTVWMSFFEHLDKSPQLKFPLFNSVTIGGSACPLAMIQRFAHMGVRVLHAYGLTETSPLATACNLLPKHAPFTPQQIVEFCAGSAGRAVYGVDMVIKDEEGRVLPKDGKAVGEICLKGPWITNGYFKVGEGGKSVEHGEEKNILDNDGYFHTGDVATIDSDGYIHIADRTKDVIKSGGEWISSIDLENVVLGHPFVANAAVIGLRHAKWQERPLLIIVVKADKLKQHQTNPDATRKSVYAFLEGKIPKFWTPDDIEFVDAIPLTATGKVSKLTLRSQFKDYTFKTEGAVIQFQSKL